MGIRPKMLLLCGIDDLQHEEDTIIDPRVNLERFDERYERVFDLTSVPAGLRHMFSNVCGAQETALAIGDVVHWDGEYGLGNILGHVWDYQGSSDTFYALAACDPKFGQAGYQILPTISEDEDISEGNYWLGSLKHKIASGQPIERDALRTMLRRTHSKRQLHKYNQNYRSFGMDFLWKSEATLFALRSAGVSVGRRDLKLMLYWQWS